MLNKYKVTKLKLKYVAHLAKEVNENKLNVITEECTRLIAK